MVGSRPNFVKAAPTVAALSQYPDRFDQVTVHTGQHYDENMSEIFFQDLDMTPDEFLNAGSGSHANQTARIMLAFEPIVLQHRPDLVLVVGDVNSTLACALVCAKLCVPVAHVEAGLRSFDRTMPEEVNRLLTDQLAEILFTPSPDASANLLREGIAPEKIHFVGNVMIDCLVRVLPGARRRQPLRMLGVSEQAYVVVTLHRPSNVDDPQTLAAILSALQTIGRDILVIFPVHPRTRNSIRNHGLSVDTRVFVTDPVGYVDFLALEAGASLVITDSGGIQEETTYLGVPCLTVRPNTERPITMEIGTNRLVAAQEREIVDAARSSLSASDADHSIPELWDGRTASRIAQVLCSWESRPTENGRA